MLIRSLAPIEVKILFVRNEQKDCNEKRETAPKKSTNYTSPTKSHTAAAQHIAKSSYTIANSCRR